MKVTCPKCESEDVQRLAMIYQHGTATSISTGSTLAGVGDDLAVAATVTSGKQQSLLAQQAAPPQPKPSSDLFHATGLVLLLLGPVVFLMSRDLLISGLMVFVGAILFASARAINREAEEYNRTTYPRLKEQWERTWLCLRCGNRFEASV